MLTADLEAELARSAAALAADRGWPTAPFKSGASWRPAPDADPASFATSAAFEVARANGVSAADVAVALAVSLGELAWIRRAEPAGRGYLIITVTDRALAGVADRIVATGPDCARSTILSGATTVLRPWPDLLHAQSWARAWQDQASATTGNLAATAGASTTIVRERGRLPGGHPPGDSGLRAAVRYFGADSIRYRLARARGAGIGTLAAELAAAAVWTCRGSDPLEAVQVAYAEAASTLRWAADLRLTPARHAVDLLGTQPERRLLGLLAWLPIRVASAARRHRPDDLAGYLEAIAGCWLDCAQHSPALPFRGRAAAADQETAGARLVLADASRLVLRTGLGLAGIAAIDQF